MRRGFYKESWVTERFVERSDSLRLRVNDAEISSHPAFKDRWESRENGQTTVLMNEDLQQIENADLYLELWGGHPGSGPKSVSINGNTAHRIPDSSTMNDNCEYTYPVIPLNLTELYMGKNSVQFSIGRGNSFWGHCIVDNAALFLGLKKTHPSVACIRESAQSPLVAIVNDQNLAPSNLCIFLDIAQINAGLVSRVDFFAKYIGFDENGTGNTNSWHGYTLNRRHVFHLGSTETFPYEVAWDTTMTPDQDEDIEIMAVVSFAHGIRYGTKSIKTALPARKQDVAMYTAKDLPAPFWSRDNKPSSCTIYLDIEPDDIDKAQLHIRIWDGGEGTIAEHFTINGFSYPIATGVAVHDVVYCVRDVDPKHLHHGKNELRLLSNTEHHGIEVLLPGPALIIRSKEY